jgi:hypothetical protein
VTVNLNHFLRAMAAMTMQVNYGPQQHPHTKKMWLGAEELYRMTGAILDELSSYGDFSIIWPRCRVWFPLQFRLCAEQVMWDRGGAWRKYVTGFNPVKGEATKAQPALVETYQEARAGLIAAGQITPQTSSEDIRAMIAKRRAIGAKVRGRSSW